LKGQSDVGVSPVQPASINHKIQPLRVL
jgi:hypothetical protein